MFQLLAVIGLAVVPASESSQGEIDLARSYYHFSLAKTLTFAEKYPQAIAEFEKAITSNPQSSELRLQLVETLLRAQEIKRALEQGGKAIDLAPNSVEAHLLLGHIYFGYRWSDHAKMLQKARAEFERVMALDPANSRALEALGRIYLIKEEYPRAADVLAQLNQIRPSFLEGYYLSAHARLGLKETELAIELLEQSLKFGAGGPQNLKQMTENLKLLGNLYEQTNQYEKAVQTYRQTIQYNPGVRIRRQLGVLLVSLKHFEEAIPILKALSDQYPQDSQIKLELGKALKGQEKYSEASGIFYQLLSEDPDHIEGNYQLALVLAGLGERSEAIDKLLHVLEIEKSQRSRDLFRTHLAFLYREMRQFDEAISLFEEMSLERPDDVFVQVSLIETLRDAGRLEEGLSRSLQLLKEHPDVPRVSITRALVLSAARRLKDAISLLEDRIRQYPDQDEFYLWASQLYLEHKKYAQAERIIRQALSIAPDNQRIQFQLAAVHERRDSLEHAEQLFTQILENDPEHAGALNYWGYMLADRGIRLQEALEYIQRAVEIEAHNGAYLDSLGWVYFKLNRLELAEVHLRRAAKINGTDSTICDHLGDLYYKIGDYAKACQYYEQAIRYTSEQRERERVHKKLADVKKRLSRAGH